MDHLVGLLAAEFAHRWPAADRSALWSDLHGLTVSHVVAGKSLSHRYADTSLDLTLGGRRRDVLV